MKNYPLVSVIMPVCNEEDFIERSLSSVLNQDYPGNKMEIIIADGMSKDKTREKIQNLKNNHSNIRLIDNPKKIVPTGMNLAIKEAKGEIIVRVDGHCEIQPDYVRECVEALEDQRWDVMGGPIETIGETYTAKAIALAMSSIFGVGGSAFRTIKDREMETETVPFAAYRKSLFENVGLFDEELVRNQDDEHNYRVREKGGRILLNPKIRSIYYSRGSLKTLWRQYFQYGYWKVRVMQKHPRQMQPRQYVPALFVSALIGLGILGFWFPAFHLALLFLMALYLAVNLLFSLRIALKNGISYLWIMPVIFAVLHISYGAGFLTGLIKFWGKKP
jgi:succinoglycan biosynthesis protein ExoA